MNIENFAYQDRDRFNATVYLDDGYSIGVDGVLCLTHVDLDSVDLQNMDPRLCEKAQDDILAKIGDLIWSDHCKRWRDKKDDTDNALFSQGLTISYRNAYTGTYWVRRLENGKSGEYVGNYKSLDEIRDVFAIN